MHYPPNLFINIVDGIDGVVLRVKLPELVNSNSIQAQFIFLGACNMKWIFAVVMWAVVLIMVATMTEKPTAGGIKPTRMGASNGR